MTPQEIIRKLANEVERVLVAGAHLASADSGLAQSKTALDSLVAQLGAKAPPVIARLSDQTGKVLSAKPKDQPMDLLTLASTVAQVRAAQAQPAQVGGVDEALTPVADIATPCNSKDLYALHEALVTTGAGREEKIREAVQQQTIADLRLVHAVIQAMGDHYGTIADLVSKKAVPQFGPAVVAPILAKLKFPGKAIDGRRLQALVAIQRSAAGGLLERAVNEGSAEMREAALDAIADFLPGVPEFEPMVLGVIDNDRAGGVRRAAIRALKGYGSDRSLATTLAALEDDRTQRVAAEALGGSKHPDVVTRLLDRLAEGTKKAKAKAKKDDKDQANEKARAVAECNAILMALGCHSDKRIPEVVLPIVPTFGVRAAGACLKSANLGELRTVADFLQQDEADLFPIAARAALSLPATEVYDRFIAPFQAKEAGQKVGEARLNAIESALLSLLAGNATLHDVEEEANRDDGLAGVTTSEAAREARQPIDPRFAETLLSMLLDKKLWKDGSKGLMGHVINLLGALKETRAVDKLVEVAEDTKKNKDLLNAAVRALGNIGDRKALPALLACLDTGDYRIQWPAQRAILELAEENTVAKVREMYVALKDPDSSKHWYLRNTLHQLERRFPGS